MSARLIESAYLRLMADAGVQDLIQTGKVGRDPVGEAYADGWIFQGLNDIRPYRNTKGTGTSAIVVRSVDSWGTNQHNTVILPILQVLVWSDPTRNGDGSATQRDALAKGEVVAMVVDRLFHDAANAAHAWPGLFVTSCVRRDGPNYVEVPDDDGTWRAELRYEVAL